MSIPAHITAAIRSGKFTYCGEAQLSNFGETARKGRYVEFLLDDGPDGSARHPFHGLSCGREKGQRFGLIAVPLGDDDAVAEPKERTRSPATTRAEKARRLCGVVQFQDWMKNRNGVQNWPPEWHSEPARYQQVSFWVKEYCGVQSKSELDNSENQSQSHNPAACWDMLLAEYEQQTGRMAERHG